MKKGLIALLALFAFNVHAEKLTVAATPVPHAELLEFVKPMLAKEGVELDIKVFTDYVQPNLQVAQGKIDANFFQHKPYLIEFNEARSLNLTSVVGVHIEPFGGYSLKIKDIKNLPKGAVVAIPNDPTNGGRALLLLDKEGIIKLKDNTKLNTTSKDIIENPHQIKVRELEAATLPRVLKQFDLAMINTNYALAAKLNPLKDALIIEGSQSPYVNILVSREDNKSTPAMQKLAKALTSPETKKFIQDKYKGAVLPAF